VPGPALKELTETPSPTLPARGRETLTARGRETLTARGRETLTARGTETLTARGTQTLAAEGDLNCKGNGDPNGGRETLTATESLFVGVSPFPPARLEARMATPNRP
jgi:hypothetical protein